MEIFCEFATHAEHLKLVELRDVVAHLVDLLEAVLLVVAPDEVLVLPEGSEIVLDGLVRICFIEGSEELHYHGSTTAQLRADVSLDTINLGPQLVAFRPLKQYSHCLLVHNMDRFTMPVLSQNAVVPVGAAKFIKFCASFIVEPDQSVVEIPDLRTLLRGTSGHILYLIICP